MLLPALVAALCAAVAPAHAVAQPGLLLGVTDDGLKWSQRPQALQSALSQLGLGAVRYTQTWAPGRLRLSAPDAQTLARGLQNAKGLRVVLSVYGPAGAAPQTDDERNQYCGYVRSIVRRFPQIRDVVVWNEVNSSRFWAPQFGPDGSSLSPASYEALLADCYGTLQAARPGLNVIASVAPRGNDDPQAHGVVGISPADFVRGMGTAYRASGRLVKVFDTFALNAYGLTSAEPPWRTHAHATDLSEGDYPRLVAALSDAFAGTGQPLPGAGGVTVWYLEDGFQTTIDPSKASAYTGVENAHALVSPLASEGVDQATQLAGAIRLAYCQPGVGAFFNFLLADETDLAAWQSGVLWADLTPKPSFDALADVVHEVQNGDVDCSALPATAGSDPSLVPDHAGGRLP